MLTLHDTVNQAHHRFVTANADVITSYEGGHLEYHRGRGVRKVEEADCEMCVELGLNDGRWHPVGK